MLDFKKTLMLFLALVVLVGGTGFTVLPSGSGWCAQVHNVRAGETLWWIGRLYDVDWKILADNNHIANPRLIYPGQQICIPQGKGSKSPVQVVQVSSTPGIGWSFEVIKVVHNESVSIRTHNFPDNVLFEVEIRSDSTDWESLAKLDSDRGGNFRKVYDLPDKFDNVGRLYLLLTQTKKGVSVERTFYNASGVQGGLQPIDVSVIPTIWIVSVVRNSKVTINTANFPPGLKFDVLMGPMGTRGVGGYHVGTIDSGSGGMLSATFNIPSQLRNHRQISIRTQNLWTGYYSYNWFYNNTTY